MQNETERSPTTLFERYIFLEELIGRKAEIKESVEREDQLDLLLDYEQCVISELAEQTSRDVNDLKRKIRIFFTETDFLGRSGTPKKPIEHLADSILADLNTLILNANRPPKLIVQSA